MGNTAVVECLDFQSGVFPTAFLCAPSFADAKPLDSAENKDILGYKPALIPNSLKAGFYNIGKTIFKDSQVGKLLKMSRQTNKYRKLFGYQTVLYLYQANAFVIDEETHK